MNIIENFKRMLRNKSGKVFINNRLEDNEDYSKRKQDRELDDMGLELIFLIPNIVYWAGKGIYKGVKKISEAYKKYSGE